MKLRLNGTVVGAKTVALAPGGARVAFNATLPEAESYIVKVDRLSTNVRAVASPPSVGAPLLYVGGRGRNSRGYSNARSALERAGKGKSSFSHPEEMKGCYTTSSNGSSGLNTRC